MAYCAKCGKETRESQIYCEECLSEMEDSKFGDLFDSFEQKPELENTFDNSSEDDFTKILEELQGPREAIKDIDEKELRGDSSPSTVGDVFSDAVSAISSLEDELEDMANYNGLDEYPEPQKEGFFARLFKRKEKNKKSEDTSLKSSLEDASEKKLNKKDLRKAKREKAKREKEEKAKLKLAQAKKAKAEREQAKKAKAEKKQSKKKDSKKAEAKKKSAKQESKKKEVNQKEKSEKGLKKENTKPENVEEILVEEEGHFNPVVLAVALGAFLIFTIFILVKVYTVPYNNSIETASRKFDNKKYNKAFEEIYGLSIKKNDQHLYDKIMTVMYVNKQLNSYNNYMELNMYPEALDSLVKGLRRYDKYIDQASELGIADDLDYVRGQILKVLKKEFGLSEKKAMKLTKIEDQSAYSIQVYDIVIENTDYVNQ